MSKEPTLKSKTYNDDGGTYKINVKGGLHFIKGNHAPYFALTADVYRKNNNNGSWEDDSGGACHDLILNFYPEFADFAALHLSDIDGVPMHAAENGYYWLAGCVEGGLGEQYHGGSGSSAKTPNECLNILCDHFRITKVEALALISKISGYYDSDGTMGAKIALTVWVETQKPRWKKEADDCIKNHGLIVFGDTYLTK